MREPFPSLARSTSGPSKSSSRSARPAPCRPRRGRSGSRSPRCRWPSAIWNRSSASIFSTGTVRPLAVTAAGSLLRQRASALIADARQIGPLLRETAAWKGCRSIRVGIVDSLSRALTVAARRPISRRRPTRSPSCLGLTASHASDLLTRRLDLVPGRRRSRGPGPGSNAGRSPRSRTCCCCPPARRRRAACGVAREACAVAAADPVQLRGRRLGSTSRRICGGWVIDGAGLIRVRHAVWRDVHWWRRAAGLPSRRRSASARQPCRRLVSSTAPLPGPQISRKLTLVARHRELGRLPRELGEMVRGVLVATGASQ